MKKLAIGVDSDQYDEAPGVVLTSMVKHVENAVYGTISEVKDSGWTSGVRVFGLKEKGVGWVHDDAARVPGVMVAQAKGHIRHVFGLPPPGDGVSLGGDQPLLQLLDGGDGDDLVAGA